MAIGIALLVLQALSYLSTIGYNGVKIEQALQPHAVTALRAAPAVHISTPFRPGEAYVEQIN